MEPEGMKGFVTAEFSHLISALGVWEFGVFEELALNRFMANENKVAGSSCHLVCICCP